MTALTRRRNAEAPLESWSIHYGDVRVGWIGRRSGTPDHVDAWAWSCGFYPGVEPRDHRSGSAGTFDAAREAFERAWSAISANLTEANFEAWRAQRDLNAWLERMRAAHLPVPTQVPSGIARCFCGETLTVAGVDAHIAIAHKPLTESV